MPGVGFHYQQTDFKISQPKLISTWLSLAVTKEGRDLVTLDYIFCSDDFLLEMNRSHLKHNFLTDVITFDYTDQPGKTIEGEVYISVDRVKENAATFSQKFEDELHRVMIHGLLHLVGLNDKTDRERAEMRKKEEAYLSLRR